MKRFILGLLKLALLGLSLCLMLGWLQNLHPIFDSASNFRLHFIVLLAPLLLIMLLARQWRWLIAGAITATISLYLSVPYLPGFQPATSASTETDHNLTIVQFNMRFNNRKTNQAINAITTVNPDIYLLQELTETTRPIFKVITKTHSHFVDCSSPRVGSVAVVSRHPLDPTFQPICNRRDGLVIARYIVNNQPVTVASLHLRWPWPYRQHLQVDRIKEMLTDLPGPFILAGDFNASPWTHTVQRVAQITQSIPVPGLLLTWSPRFLEFDLDMGPILPIDQIMMRGASPVSRKLLPDGGSDHFPVQTQIRLQ